MWQPVQTVDHLLARFESSSLDYKTIYDLSSKETRYDIAKDIAAFANAYGGSIVVGVFESAGTVVRLEGVTDVAKLMEEGAAALHQHCEPCPTTPEEYAFVITPADAIRLLSPGCAPPASDVVLVTLDVRSDPRAPIGVKPFEPGPRAMPYTYRFPVRVGDQTRFMPPTELAMWMNSHERRIAIQLRRWDPKTHVRIFHAGHGARDGEFTTALFEFVDEQQLVAVFTQPDEAPAQVPLTFISAIWREPKDGQWSLHVEGTIFPRSFPRFGFRPRRR